MRTNSYAALGALCAILLVSGCAATPSQSDDPQSIDIQLIMERTTQFQRDIIEDGLVTSAEFERALLARRDCVSAAGAVPSDVYENEVGEPTFDFDITADTEEELNEIQEAADACLGEYFAEVGSVWAYQRLLSPEERDEQRPLAVECLESAGVTGLTESASAQQMVEAIQSDEKMSDAERACVIDYHGIFSTWTNDSDQEHE